LIRSVAGLFKSLALVLLIAVTAIWVEMLSRCATALRARRLARTLKPAGEPT
jgi:hypothetical protein